MSGIDYYVDLTQTKYIESDDYKECMLQGFESAKDQINTLINNHLEIFESMVLQPA